MCNDNQPWAVNDDLAYGFAATALSGKGEADTCCGCYELTFTSGEVKGKRMVVQVMVISMHAFNIAFFNTFIYIVYQHRW